MFGTRDLFIKSEAINKVADQLLDSCVNNFFQEMNSIPENPEEKQEYIRNSFKKILLDTPQSFFLLRLYQQAKQISQIIAYIWRNVEERENPNFDTAKKLQQYFAHPTEKKTPTEIGENLKKLFAANPRYDSEENVEANLLRKVFEDYQSNKRLIFPIFDDFERNQGNSSNLGYLFEVNVNTFNGLIEDVDQNSPSLFKFIIPFPPRPQIGEGTVTYFELEQWIVDRTEKKYFADNPYIPTTCC
ncbi:hypothetical protein [Nostoc sp.]|uniref:hypothetical protein n=1 Tax=Nostoc sp. TaxID=1180 RepID=UPI002FFB2AC7